ncbi:hypothetical protein [Streptomyces sp. NPDC018045]|uniref:hypothetical protein n=1 Tax=Streptomyces sp. NPDC018045 TaxID=3365037 RepID=UPI00378C4C7D
MNQDAPGRPGDDGPYHPAPRRHTEVADDRLRLRRGRTGPGAGPGGGGVIPGGA